MKPNNVFFVGFTKCETTIIHSQCGCKASQILSNDNQGFYFSCPICKIEEIYFLIKAWDKVLEELKKSSKGTKMIVCKCYTINGEVLSEEEAIVLEKRDIK